MKILLLGEEAPDTCELCGKEDELRPYGPDGERICFECGMKDKETTEKMMALRLTQNTIDLGDLQQAMSRPH